MRIRRLRVSRCMSPIKTMIVALAVVLGCLVGSATALAVRGHVFAKAFGEKGSGAGQFEEPSGVAVDEATGDWASGDVYVTTSSQQRPEYDVVDVFKPEAGGKEPAKTVAVIEGVCSLPNEPVPQCPGSEFRPFGGPQGVAVDSSNGDVVVADGDVVDVFEPEPGMPGMYRYLFDITGTPAGSFEDVGGSEGVQGVDVGIHGPERRNPRTPAEDKVVDEFSSSGQLIRRLTGTPAGPFEDVQSVAVDDDPSSSTYGDVFVGDYRAEAGAGVVDVFGPDIVVPDVTTKPASGSQIEPKTHTFSAVLNGTVNPDEAGEATCEFVWGLSTSELTKTAECEGPGSKATPIPGGPGDDSPVPVKAKLEGLASDTKYYYRLQASNVHQGKVETNTGEGAADEGSFTTPGPGIEEESVSDVTATSAALAAEVNPNGSPTEVRFEYGPSTEYGSEVPVPPGEAIGSGEGGVTVEQHIQGLSPGTTYHYRVVAVSQISVEVSPGKFETQAVTTYGEDQTFTTQSAGGGSSTLLDGREWELVSPPDKHGALILGIDVPEPGVIQAAADGDALSYLASPSTEEVPQRNSNEVQVLSTRGLGGTSSWSSRDLTMPHVGATDGRVGVGQEYRFFSENLETAIVQPFGAYIPCEGGIQPCLSPEASEQTAFLADLEGVSTSGGTGKSPTYTPLVTGCPAPQVGTSCPKEIEEHADVPPGTVFGEDGEERKKAPLSPLPPSPS